MRDTIARPVPQQLIHKLDVVELQEVAFIGLPRYVVILEIISGGYLHILEGLRNLSLTC